MGGQRMEWGAQAGREISNFADNHRQQEMVWDILVLQTLLWVERLSYIFIDYKTEWENTWCCCWLSDANPCNLNTLIAGSKGPCQDHDQVHLCTNRARIFCFYPITQSLPQTKGTLFCCLARVPNKPRNCSKLKFQILTLQKWCYIVFNWNLGCWPHCTRQFLFLWWRHETLDFS